MENRPSTSAWAEFARPDLQGDPGDVSDFVHVAGQAAFQLADSQSEDSNQRTGDRRHYPFRQRIAPILNGAMPVAEQFREVPFSDISTTGASFLWEGELGFDRLVVELGAGSNVSLVMARVIWVEKVDPTESRPSGVDPCLVRVGCQLVSPAEPGPSR